MNDTCRAHDNPRGRCSHCLQSVAERLQALHRAALSRGQDDAVAALESALDLVEGLLPE
jgi:hypothetical protein